MAYHIIRKKSEGGKWTRLLSNLQLLLALIMGGMAVNVSSVAVGDNSIGYGKQGFGGTGGLQRIPYKSLVVNKQQRRLKAHGNEIIPAAGGANDISEEPTCEELRAMWRYYKRQSRAELTNEIPQFGKNPFFDMFPSSVRTPQIPSFGMTKGRAKNRMRPQNPYYGRVMYRPNKQKERGGAGRNRNSKPFERVRDMIGKGPSQISSDRNGQRPVTAIPSVVVHHSPPPQSVGKESSFQKLKDVYREERMREKGQTKTLPGIDNREFGKIVLSPPGGQDGRRANKPRELMTAFEKIRFGHADDILDEGIRPNLDVMKRRTFSPAVVLNKQAPQWKQQLQNKRFLSNPMLLLTSSSTSDRTSASKSSSYFGQQENENNNNNNVRAPANDEQQLGSIFESESIQDVPSLQSQELQLQENPVSLFRDVDSTHFNDEDDNSLVVSKFSNPSAQMTKMPSCVEVEHEFCNQTSDCSCTGFALYRCYINQCQILPLAFSVQDVPVSEDETLLSENTSNTWHSEPIPSEKLGIWEEPTDGTARLTRQQQRQVKNIKNEGNPSRLTDTTYLLLQDQTLSYP